MSNIFVKSAIFAAVFIVFSSCGKGVDTSGSAANSSSGTPPSITTNPGGGGSITPTPLPSTGCPADQIAVFNFAQSSPADAVIDLDLSGSSSILFVSVGGQEVSFTFDPSAGAVTLSDAGQPGEQIQIEVCLPSPIGKPTPKPGPSKEPCPTKS